MNRLDDRLTKASEDLREVLRTLPDGDPLSRPGVVLRRVGVALAAAAVVAGGLFLPGLLRDAVPPASTQHDGPVDPSAPTTTVPAPEVRVAAPERLALAGGTGVGVFDVSGEQVSNLVRDEMLGMGVGFGPIAVAPGGETVYVTMVLGAHLAEIYAVAADGSQGELVAVGSDPAVSSDGTKLAFTVPVPLEEGHATALRERLVVRDLVTGEKRTWEAASPDSELISDLRSLSWSADSSRLAFELVYEDGSELRILDITQGTSVLDSQEIQFPEGVVWVRPTFRGDTGTLLVVEQRGGLDPSIDPEEFSIVEIDPGTGTRRAMLVSDLAGPVVSLDADATGQHLLVILGHLEHDAADPGPRRVFHWDGTLTGLELEEEDPLAAAW